MTKPTGRNRRAVDAVKSVAAGDDVAGELVLDAVLPKTDARRVRVEVVDAHVIDLEVQRAAGRQARLDEIVDDLVLTVDGDRAAAGELGHVDAVPRAAEGEIDAIVPQPFAREPFADANLVHQIDRALLEHARANPLDHVLPAALFEDDGVDALEMQQLPEHQSGGARADDADLGARGHGYSLAAQGSPTSAVAPNASERPRRSSNQNAFPRAKSPEPEAFRHTLSMRMPLATLGLATVFLLAGVAAPVVGVDAQSAPQTATAPLPDLGERKTITEADCTATKLGTTIPASMIGEPVSSVTLTEPKWTAAADTAPAFCTVDGSMAPIDPAARPINFRVVFPASWTLRVAQLGGGGMNGVIPNLGGGRGASVGPAQGIVTYGSDSGHAVKDAPEWTLADEAIKNLGYMQMKKTHDAAMVLVERMYGARPRVELLHRYVAGRSRSADGCSALSRRLRRHHRQRPHRQLLVADARAGAHPHPGEAAWPAG